MNKTFKLKSLLLSMVVAGAATASIAPTAAQAGVSANVGAVTNYVFRGVEQTESASGYAGLDYENDSGFYVGTWVADVDRGLEYDIYAGYGTEVEGVSLGLGATYFGYTLEAFDSPYLELNLSAGFGMFSVGYDFGTHEKNDTLGFGETDYDNMYIGAEYEAFSATLGSYDPDTDTKDDAYMYLDVSYSLELAAGLDGSVTYTYVDQEADVANETYLVFGVSKSFDLM